MVMFDDLDKWFSRELYGEGLRCGGGGLKSHLELRNVVLHVVVGLRILLSDGISKLSLGFAECNRSE